MADPSGDVLYDRPLKFRLEITETKQEDKPGFNSTDASMLTFVQERGSADVFNALVERFVAEWP